MKTQLKISSTAARYCITTFILLLVLSILSYIILVSTGEIGEIGSNSSYTDERMGDIAPATIPLPDPCALEDVICPHEYKRITASVTAYTKAETCPDRECITASGATAIKGVSAACPRSVPFGTSIRIGGDSYVCHDRTARKYDGRFDLFFGETTEDYHRAKRWGIQTKTVEIAI